MTVVRMGTDLNVTFYTKATIMTLQCCAISHFQHSQHTQAED